MCGISGVHTHYLNAKELNAFETLMFLSNLRGFQGAGIAARRALDGNISSAKVLSNGVTLVTSKAYKDVMAPLAKPVPNTVIGHTRWPTKGAIEMPFVHPHEKKKVIGVHNGTMTMVNWNFLKPGQSDSSMIYDTINDKGFDHMFQTSTGAMCLVWMNKEEDTLNFFRNNERPLSIAYLGHEIRSNDNARCNAIFWSSEAIMLDFALIRAGFSRNNFIIEDLPVDTWVKFDMTPNKGDISPVEVTKMTKKSRTFQASNDWTYDDNVESFPRSTPVGADKTNTSRPKAPENPWRSWEKLGDSVKSGEGVDHGLVINSYIVSYDTATIHVCEYEDGSKSRSNYPAPYWKALEDSRSGKSGTTALTVVPNKSAEESAKVFEDSVKHELAEEDEEEIAWEDYGVDPLEDLGGEVIGEKDINDLFDKAMGKINIAKPRDMSGHALETSRGNFVSRKEFYRLITEGCGNCGSNSVNPRKVVWYNKTDYLCDTCQTDETARAACFLHPLDMH